MTQRVKNGVAIASAAGGAASFGWLALWVGNAEYRRARLSLLIDEPGGFATVSPLLLLAVVAASALLVVGGGYLVTQGNARA